MADLEAVLRSGIAELELTAADAQIEQLLAFVRLLAKWNRSYNLTSIDRPEDMVRLHLLDSLAILPFLRGKRILDVGTGAGLPGIPLAILDADREFVLLDSNSKKTRFVTQAGIELGLRHVAVQHARVEQFRPAVRFDTVLCRAFASLDEILAMTRRLLSSDGVLLAMKGKLQAEELSDLEPGVQAQIHALEVPGLDAERHVAAITVRG